MRLVLFLVPFLAAGLARGDTPAEETRIDKYQNGKIAEKTHYRDGQKDGLHEECWESGQRREESTYRKGKLNGTLRNWFDDGTLSQRAEIVDGKRDGLTTDYQRNGKLLRETRYRAGKLEGPSKRYDARGALEAEENYLSDERSGEARYYVGGNVREIVQWKDGKRSRRRVLDEGGKVTLEEEFLADGSVKVPK